MTRWFSWQTLRRRPRYAALVVFTLALGIGSTTAISTLAHALFLRPLPYPQPERLARIIEEVEGDPPRGIYASWLNFEEWQEAETGFDRLAARAGGALALARENGDERLLRAAFVSPEYLPLLGAEVAAGRTFGPEDNLAPRAHPVVVLSHAVWETEFGLDPAVVGSTLPINGEPYTVIGVLASGFVDPFAFEASPVEVYAPAMMLATVDGAQDAVLTIRRFRRFQVIGRVRAGTTIEEAALQMDLLADRMALAYPDDNGGFGTQTRPLGRFLAGDLRQPVALLFGGALTLLVIAVVNVTSLALVRLVGRTPEFATRLALGARRRHIAAVLVGEAVLLSAVAGVLAIAVTRWQLSSIVAASPVVLPQTLVPRVDSAAILTALTATSVAALALGGLPALAARRILPAGARVSSGSIAGDRRSGVRSGLVVFEVATALVLLVGSTVMIQRFLELHWTDTGYDTDGVLAMRLTLTPESYPTLADRLAFTTTVTEAAENLPDVVWVGAWGPNRPGGAGGGVQSVVAEERPVERAGDAAYSRRHTVDPGTLEGMGISVVLGRDFERTDREDAPLVAIVSESFATRLWPDTDPLGRRFHQFIPPGQPEDLYPTYTVVGIASDAAHGGRVAGGAITGGGLDFYTPHGQGMPRAFTLLVRGAGRTDALTEPLLSVIDRVDPELVVADMRPLRAFLSLEEAPARFSAFLMGLFGAAALFLASLGLYGVLAFMVGARGREIGLRSALGATDRQNVGLFVRRGLRLIVIGISIGTAIAWTLTRVAATTWLEVGGPGLHATLLSAALLLGVGTLACYLPARRAVAVDPTTMLRDQR